MNGTCNPAYFPPIQMCIAVCIYCCYHLYVLCYRFIQGFIKFFISIFRYGDIVFNSPRVTLSVTCSCSDQFSGDRCQHQRDPCKPSPCLFGGQCVEKTVGGGVARVGSTDLDRPRKGFQCLCPALRTGERCELESTDTCRPNPCLNGGTCKGSKTNGKTSNINHVIKQNVVILHLIDFFCLCRPGYRGARCESVVDSCTSASASASNPCLNGGACVPLVPGYRCRCPDNFYGVHCELSTMGFSELSHVALPPLTASSNDVSVIFTTTKRNALLLYNRGERLGMGFIYI